MRFCKALTCDEAATVYYRGPWCSRHVLQFGDAPALQAGRAAPSARPLAGGAEGLYPFAPAASPAVLSEAELVNLLGVGQWIEA